MKSLWFLTLIALVQLIYAQSELDESYGLGGYMEEEEEPILEVSPSTQTISTGEIASGICTVTNVADPNSYVLKIYRERNGELEQISDDAAFNFEVSGPSDLEDRIICRAEKDGKTWTAPVTITLGPGYDEPSLSIRTHSPNARITALFCEIKPKPTTTRRYRFRWINPQGRMIANGPLAVVQSHLLAENGPDGYICESYDMLTRRKMRVGLQYQTSLRAVQAHSNIHRYEAKIFLSPPTAQPNRPLVLTCTVSPMPQTEVTYIWSIDGRRVSSNSEVFRIPNFTTADLKNYQCDAGFMNEFGTRLNVQATLKFRPNVDSSAGAPSNIDNLFIRPEGSVTRSEGSAHEIHCTVESDRLSVNDLIWLFEPRGTARQRPVTENGWRIENANTHSKTSFISKEGVSTSDDGTYICRLRGTGIVQRSGLIVEASRIIGFEPITASTRVEYDIEITPETRRIRRGETVNFECRVMSRGSGTVSGSMLASADAPVSVQTRKINEQLYQVTATGFARPETQVSCSFDGEVAVATVYMSDQCNVNERRCNDGTCIASGRFCNGIRDCPDGSDETNCDTCDPVVRTCGQHNGYSANRTTYNVNWECDGENDCGNGFDEADCPQKNVGQCGGRMYQCRNSPKQIFKAYVCDKTPDCPQGDDESGCTSPVITENPRRDYTYDRGTLVTLTCTATGKPLPRVIWRLNWACLPGQTQGESQTPYLTFLPRGRHEVNSRVDNCNSPMPRVTSTLTIRDFQPGDDGIYNCEAIAGSQRTMSVDYRVSFNEGPIIIQ